MSKEKQIEEMSCAICDECRAHTPSCECIMCDAAIESATAIYNAGYRKQSEWISVEERLPHVSGKYICGVKDKKGNTWTVSADWSLEMKTWFGEFGEIKNIVTHWMPLPEAPKGGEE